MTSHQAQKPFALALMGPTASGKTALSIELARVLNGEIVSIDSALVYRGLDIGAAKPELDERQGVRHWMMDICDPSKPYSVAEFRQQAIECIEDIALRGKIPILVGGTMLYFKALLHGLSDMPETSVAIRQEIEAEAEREGWPAIHAKLAHVDPISAERIHPNHSQRISRALEVWRSSGKPMSQWQTGFSDGLLKHYSWRQLAISPSDRAVLHGRIAQRFQLMLERGFLDEVKALRARGDLYKALPAMRAVGYRQAWEHLDGDYDFEQMVQKGTAATRQLAKRQLTWLRSWQGLNWVDTLESTTKFKDIVQLREECLSFCAKRAI